MENLCTFDGCGKIVRVKSRGLCSGHNYQWKMGYDLYPIGSLYNVTKYCIHNNCDNKYYSSGYCQTHYDMLQKLGVTPEKYDELFEKQGGKCAICKNEPLGRRQRFSIDHDHSCCTGRKSCGKCIRGLLCNKCNLGIGNFDDDINRLKSAVSYLE